MEASVEYTEPSEEFTIIQSKSSKKETKPTPEKQKVAIPANSKQAV